MLTPFAPGSYRSLVVPGRPFSAGIVADQGFDLVHAVFHRPVPLHQGLESAAAHVRAAGRPVTALGAFELRIPDPLSREEFDAFNAPYAERLTGLGLVSENGLVAARTNVAPTVAGVAEPSLHAFTYTVPGRGRPRSAFRLSGATETRRDASEADQLRSIVEVLEGRLAELGLSWDDATTISVYGEASDALWDVRESFGTTGLRGLTWFPALPPLDDFAFEIDAQGVGTELVL
ncbi:MAG TPA: hypothetical protein VGO86_01260 [Candidatus Dormibacteraeota bacterium]